MSGFSLEAEVEFISGITSTGLVSDTSYWTYNGDLPATYNPTVSEAHKFGGSTAGTAGTITYFFDAASDWTPVEQEAWVASMHLWTAVANVTFQAAPSAGAASIVIIRDPNEVSGFATVTGDSAVGGTAIDTTGTGTIVIGPDATVAPDGNLQTLGGYAYLTMVHEVGHVLGLGHGGIYNGTANPATQQIGVFDTTAYSLMSYIAPYTGQGEPVAQFFSQYTETFDWGFSEDGYANSPLTPMLLDILAAQRLYGAPTQSQFDGGETFGFNTTITGDIARFFDFDIDTTPILTIYDFGTGNTLDLSGFDDDATVDLNSGAFSSAGGLTNNIAIAFGTVIETGIGGIGDDSFTGSGVANHLIGGGGNDTLFGAAGADTLEGGTGNDTYVNPTGDIVVELAGAANGASDLIQSSASFSLVNVSNIENLTLIGTLKINAIGNTGNNRLTGNDNANTLNGGGGNDVLAGLGGADILQGGAGNDLYISPTLGVGGDTLTEAAGAAGGLHDRIQTLFSFNLSTVANVEDITLVGAANINAIGNNLANILAGNPGNNIINGGGGADTITGAGGSDTMNGGAGADLFKFAVAGTGADIINGFETALDHFNLSGGSFSNRVEAGGNTTLTHAGGSILINGVIGLSLTAWNALVVTTGRAADLPHNDAVYAGPPAFDATHHMPPIGHFGTADFLYA